MQTTGNSLGTSKGFSGPAACSGCCWQEEREEGEFVYGEASFACHEHLRFSRTPQPFYPRAAAAAAAESE